MAIAVIKLWHNSFSLWNDIRLTLQQNLHSWGADTKKNLRNHLSNFNLKKTIKLKTTEDLPKILQS